MDLLGESGREVKAFGFWIMRSISVIARAVLATVYVLPDGPF